MAKKGKNKSLFPDTSKPNVTEIRKNPPATGAKTTSTYKPKPKSQFTVNTTSMTASVSQIKRREIPEPSVSYTPRAYQMMKHIVSVCDKEVGWMCAVQDLGKNQFLIYDVYVPDQEVTAVTTDISSDGMAEIAMAMIENDQDPSHLYAWYHSHVNMQVSPSSTDEQQVEEFLDDCPIFIRGIWNKHGDEKVDVYLREDGIAFNNVRTRILLPDLDTAETAALDAAIKKNVATRIYIAPKKATPQGLRTNTTPYGNSNGYGYGGYGYEGNAYMDMYVGSEFDDDDDEDVGNKSLQDAQTISGNTGYPHQWNENTPIPQRPPGWQYDMVWNNLSWEADMMEDTYAESQKLST